MEHLLAQEEPLDAFDISRLKDWLGVMETDVEHFGPTPEDMTRIRRIKARLKLESERSAETPAAGG